MKAKVLSLLVPALLVAGAANAAEIYNKDGNKLDLYGKVDGEHYFSNDDSVDGDQSYIRIGFKGETQVNDQVTGYGQWEYQVQANSAEDSNDSFTRVGFAGLRFADTGSIDYGRNYGVIYDISSWTDVLPEFGGDTYGADNFLMQRGNGMLTYRNTDFFGLVDGLNLALQYQGKNGSPDGESGGTTNNGRKGLRQNGDGFGGSLTYDLGEGFSLGGAVASSKRTSRQNSNAYLGSGDRATAYTGGVKYDANNVYLAAEFTQAYNTSRFGGDGDDTVNGFADKSQNFEAVAQYQFDFGLRPSIAYLQSRGKKVQGYGKEDLVKYVDIGTYYYFNKNISTFVDYKINLIDKSQFTRDTNTSTDNIVAVGVVYQF